MKHVSENPELYEYETDEPRVKKGRTSKDSVDFRSTEWYKLFKRLDEGSGNDEDYDYRLFRRRFRLPFPVFKYLVQICEEKNVFRVLYHECKIPIELKIMACLRILGRDLVADDISAFSGIAESTVYSIFKDFVKNFCQDFFTAFVHLPSEIELAKSSAVFETLGLPGCFGSIDGVKVHWDKCPAEKKNLCTGKEKFPSLAFQCIVNHARKIYHISNHYWGGCTDISMSYWDDVTRNLLLGTMDKVSEELENHIFITEDMDGNRTIWKGCYLISDQGYLKRSCFIDPSRLSFERIYQLWSEWLESVRKDVECCFGILKQRFRFLKNPIRYHDPEMIEHAVKVCCILHNILLHYDRLDEFDCEEINPDDDEPETVVNENSTHEDQLEGSQPLQIITGSSVPPCLVKTTEYLDFKEALIQHFARLYCRGKSWPKHFTDRQKALNTIKGKVLSRVSKELKFNFLVMESGLKRRGYKIGKGLFANVFIHPNELIDYFQGIFRNREELDRCKGPNKYYSIQINANLFLDCYEFCMQEICLCSYANSPEGCDYVLQNGRKAKAVANARLVVTSEDGRAKLISTTSIKVGKEILWDYGKDYVFPEDI